MTEATQALVEAVREFLGNALSVEGAALSDLQDALDAVDSEVCDAEMPHHHGDLTCTRHPGHEGRHRDYLRGEWNFQVHGPDSLIERLNR